MADITSKEIATFLDLPHNGPDIPVTTIASYEHPVNKAMLFVERPTTKAWERVSQFDDILVFCSEEFGAGLAGASIWTEQPRLAFIKAVNQFFQDQVSTSHEPGIQETSTISKNAKIGKNVSIGHHCVIGDDVEVGDNTVILHNTVITGSTIIGTNCILKSGSVIGEVGFGFVMDENGIPLHMPHFGGIEIGDNVAIGANCTIERGMFENTRIANNVKIDDFVHVGHNVKVDENVRIAAGTIICGAVRIKPNSWISPSTTIRERITIGEDAFVGLASNVVKDVEPGSTVAGNPATPRP